MDTGPETPHEPRVDVAPHMPAKRPEPFAYPLLRIGVGAGTMAAALLPDPGWRVVAVGAGVVAATLMGYLTLWRSRFTDDERVLTWVRGRGLSHGADIAEGLNIGSGSLYPALSRLEKAGRLASRWEGDAPLADGKPRRRLYHVPGDTRAA